MNLVRHRKERKKVGSSHQCFELKCGDTSHLRKYFFLRTCCSRSSLQRTANFRWIQVQCFHVFPCVETVQFWKSTYKESDAGELPERTKYIQGFFHASDIRLLHSADFLFQRRNFETYWIILTVFQSNASKISCQLVSPEVPASVLLPRGKRIHSELLAAQL